MGGGILVDGLDPLLPGACAQGPKETSITMFSA